MDMIHDSDQEKADLTADYDNISPPPENFASEILGLESGEISSGILNDLVANGADITQTTAFFNALQSVPTHDFININMTENSAIIGPVILLRATTIDMKNSVISV